MAMHGSFPLYVYVILLLTFTGLDNEQKRLLTLCEHLYSPRVLGGSVFIIVFCIVFCFALFWLFHSVSCTQCCPMTLDCPFFLALLSFSFVYFSVVQNTYDIWRYKILYSAQQLIFRYEYRVKHDGEYLDP